MTPRNQPFHSKMHILEATHRYPPNVGGVERHVQEITTHLAEKGHTVTVLSADKGYGRARVSHSIGDGKVNIVRVRSIAPNDNFHFAPAVSWKTRLSNADIIHVHNYHSLHSILSMIGSRGRPVVFTPHYHGESSSRLRNYLLKGYRHLKSIERSDKVIAVSEWEQRKIFQDFAVESEVIPHGLEYRKFKSVHSKKQKTPDRYIATVGRLVDYKNIDYMIEAITASVHDDLELVIMGTGPDREVLEAIAEQAGIGHRVHFKGYVDEETKLDIISGAEAFLNLSQFEAFGMTVGEALASGTPAIINPEKGLKRWVDVDGVFPISSLETYKISKAINEVRGAEVNDRPLPSWKLVADSIEEVFIEQLEDN